MPGSITRPITDRVKEALFNIISADIAEASFLDLFAGIGSVGIEALSRGARFVRFIEKNAKAFSILTSNIELCNLKSKADIIKGDAFKYINEIPRNQFDYVYIAPPQYHGLWLKMIHLLDKNPNHLNKDAWIICQIHPNEYEAIDSIHFSEFDKRKYGDTLLVFYSFL